VAASERRRQRTRGKMANTSSMHSKATSTPPLPSIIPIVGDLVGDQIRFDSIFFLGLENDGLPLLGQLLDKEESPGPSRGPGMNNKYMYHCTDYDFKIFYIYINLHIDFNLIKIKMRTLLYSLSD
jgi:hypothetical protein